MCLYFKHEEQCIEDESDGVTSIEGKAVRYTIHCDQIMEGTQLKENFVTLKPCT